MKKLVCVIIVISVALIAVSGVLVKTKSDQAAMQQAVDETVKECYMRILDTMKSTAKNGLSGEEKDLLTARDIGYGLSCGPCSFLLPLAAIRIFMPSVFCLMSLQEQMQSILCPILMHCMILYYSCMRIISKTQRRWKKPELCWKNLL